MNTSSFSLTKKRKPGSENCHEGSGFGILERAGKVTVEVLRNITGDMLLELSIRTVRRGSLINPGRFRIYTGHISYVFKYR